MLVYEQFLNGVRGNTIKHFRKPPQVHQFSVMLFATH